MQISASSPAVVTPARTTPATERYDFHRMSPEDLLATINHLITTGQMDLDETSPLVGLIPNPTSDLQLNMTSPTSYTDPIDVYARLQQGIEYSRWSNDPKAARFYASAVAALDRFQAQPDALDVTV